MSPVKRSNHKVCWSGSSTASGARSGSSLPLALAVLVLACAAVVGVGALAAARAVGGGTAVASSPGPPEPGGGTVTSVVGDALAIQSGSHVQAGETVPGTTVSSPQDGGDPGTGLPAALPDEARGVHVPILMYHYVDDEPPPMGPYADSLTVRTPEFRRQMEYLVKNGYVTLDLATVYLAMAGDTLPGEKHVAITFDDGGLDNYTHAFPILKEHGLTATFFVITEEIGRPGYMTWDQLREMAQAGMSVQSHTAFHSDLRNTTDSKLKAELAGSRATIAEELGKTAYALCYPAGAYDERTIEAVKQAGYVMALTTKPGKDLEPGRVMELPRVRVSPGMGDEAFAQAVQ